MLGVSQGLHLVARNTDRGLVFTGKSGTTGARSEALQPRDHEGSEIAAGRFQKAQVRNRYYYEIPREEFGKGFLWVSQIARATLGVGYGG